MKIRNDLVSIKMGKKQYDFNNLILNEYLNRFAKSQLDKSKVKRVDYIKELTYCLIKFDTPIENLNENSELHNQDFDICIVDGASNITQDISEREISIKYTYRTDKEVWDYNKKSSENNYISNYCGKKIIAIGFNSHFPSDDGYSTKFPVCAVLDVSNYNIYLQENQEFVITRKDIISSDAEFHSDSEKIKGPVHLAPIGNEPLLNQEDFKTEYGVTLRANERSYAILYSVGFSSFTDYIDKEFVVGEDIQVTLNNNEIKIDGLQNYLSKEDNLYPSISLYPNNDLYPRKTKYKYLVLKYKIWQDIVKWNKNSSRRIR